MKSIPMFTHIRAWGDRSLGRIFTSPKKDVALFTHRAGRAENQDGLLYLEDPRKVLAVADGMGGEAGGVIASRLALETLDKELQSGISLEAGFRASQSAILLAAREDQDLKGMGTTLTVVEIKEDMAEICHAGDSRAFLIRGSELGLLTYDQSVASEIFYRRNPELTIPTFSPSNYYESVRNNASQNFLSGYIGAPQLTTFQRSQVLTSGDRLLLCSDGLTNYLPFFIFAEIATKKQGLVSTLSELYSTALDMMRLTIDDGGIGDNVTMILYEHGIE